MQTSKNITSTVISRHIEWLMKAKRKITEMKIIAFQSVLKLVYHRVYMRKQIFIWVWNAIVIVWYFCTLRKQSYPYLYVMNEMRENDADTFLECFAFFFLLKYRSVWFDVCIFLSPEHIFDVNDQWEKHEICHFKKDKK